MSAPSAPLTIATAIASCDRELPEAQGGGAPDWVHLLPLGEVRGRDGRAWRLDDPDALIAAFAANGADLPLDYDHQGERPATGPVPAAGWIKELARHASGIWGRVEWTARAAAMIAAKEYRYLSPTFLYRTDDGRIVRLTSAGLVHKPNLHLTALAAQEDPMTAPTPDTPKPMDPAAFATRLAAMLGLPPGADMDTLMAALEKALAAPDPSKFVPASQVADMLRQQNVALATQREREAEGKVADALKRGYITPALRGWATALCARDPEAFDAFMASATPAYAGLSQSVFAGRAGTPPAAIRGIGAETPEAMAICRQLGLAPEALL